MRPVVGSYHSPKVRKGCTLKDECFGDVVVAGYTDSVVKWPAHLYRGKLMPIFTKELVKALLSETESAISFSFGVSKYHISMWKRAITGEESAQEVYAALALARFDPKFKRKYGL